MARVLLSAWLFVATCCAQVAYTNVTPVFGPTARSGTVGVTDGSAMYVFGGIVVSSPTTFSNEMWRFDGVTWTNLTPPTPSPTGRDFYAAAIDGARGKYVLFGGRSATANELGDTWEYDLGTGTWTQMTPAVAPTARRWAAMVYDPLSARCILFGGNTNNGGATAYVGDTWSWDGTTWTSLPTPSAPSVRGRGFFSYDGSRGEAVYYGGRNGTTALADTWKWTGTSWSQIFTTGATPGDATFSGLFAYGTTYDPVRDRHVIFGGTRTGAVVGNTWELPGGGGVWTQRAPGPGPAARTGPAVCFLPTTGTTYVFGGFSTSFFGDIWSYQTQFVARSLPFGGACASAQGAPSLVVDPAPWLGDTIVVQGGLAPFGFCALLIGASTTSWAGVPLPYSLGAFTPLAPSGCQLLVSIDSSIDLPNTFGSTSFSVVVPAVPTLNGFTTYLQLVQVETDPLGVPVAVTASNGVQLTLGSR